MENITEEECIDYVYNLVINRTYEGYVTEIETIYGQLEKALGWKIEAAPDEWDRTMAVDFYIKVKKECYIGIQIKPISTKSSLNKFQWIEQNLNNHQRFSERYKERYSLCFPKRTHKEKNR